jgi:protein SCO1/2
MLICTAMAVAGPARAHDNESAPGQTAKAEAAKPAEPFPFEIGGGFTLTDHNGRTVTERDFHGSYLLVFFGYGSCEQICPVGLRRMVEVVDLLGDRGKDIQPLLVSVDPERDTPPALAAQVSKIHPRLIGLTGDKEQLAAAAKAYRVESRTVGKSWRGEPIIAHGSYIYLMRPDGAFATLLPPVLDAEAMAETIGRYL